MQKAKRRRGEGEEEYQLRISSSRRRRWRLAVALPLGGLGSGGLGLRDGGHDGLGDGGRGAARGIDGRVALEVVLAEAVVGRHGGVRPGDGHQALHRLQDQAQLQQTSSFQGEWALGWRTLR